MAPQRVVETDFYIELLESHVAVLKQRVEQQREANLSLLELNKALAEKISAAAPRKTRAK